MEIILNWFVLMKSILNYRANEIMIVGLLKGILKSF